MIDYTNFTYKKSQKSVQPQISYVFHFLLFFTYVVGFTQPLITSFFISSSSLSSLKLSMLFFTFVCHLSRCECDFHSPPTAASGSHQLEEMFTLEITQNKSKHKRFKQTKHDLCLYCMQTSYCYTVLLNKI